MPLRIEIDRDELRSGTATAIAKRLGISVPTVLARQRDAGIPTRPQGYRDFQIPLLADVPEWMNETPVVATRRTWA